MNAVLHLFAPDVLRSLGFSLLHFLWQGAAIAALTAAALLVSRRASVRYCVAMVALVLMVSAPVVTFFIVGNSGSSAALDVAPSAVPAVIQPAGHAAPPAVPGGATNTLSLNWLTLFVELWFAGVVLFSLRTAGGFFLVSRLRRRGSLPLSDEVLAICFELQDRLGISRAVRYCQSLRIDAPAVIGWFRPVVLLPVTALTGLTELQLRAVIAHELAHIRRFDAFFNLFQVAAETLLFYHPAVWWLNKRIRAERENCCDDAALAVCGNPAEYARALALMEEARVAPALVMAANRGPLASRVARLLGITEKGSSLRNAGVVFGTLCLAAALVAGNALFGLVRSASANARQQEPPAAAPSEHPIAITAPRPAPQVKPDHPAQPRIQEDISPEVQVDIQRGIQEGIQSRIQQGIQSGIQARIQGSIQGTIQSQIHAAIQSAIDARIHPFIFAPGQKSTSQEKSASAQSYLDGLKAEGYADLSADDLIGMKVQGVTPEYIHQIRAEGLKPTADELIGLKVQGVTPEYIRQIRALKLNPDIDGLIGMKVQGISPEYVENMRRIGFQPDIDQLIGMKVQGVTPEYVESLRKLGFQPDADQIIGMKVQGISPEYIQQLKELGITPDGDDLIGMKVQGINADYVKSIRSTGLNPDKDEWIGMKVQGVTADYIKSLQAAGLKPNADEVISAKVMGITPEFIEKAKSHGFKNLDLDKLIALKHAGVLE